MAVEQCEVANNVLRAQFHANCIHANEPVKVSPLTVTGITMECGATVKSQWLPAACYAMEPSPFNFRAIHEPVYTGAHSISVMHGWVALVRSDELAGNHDVDSPLVIHPLGRRILAVRNTLHVLVLVW